MHSTVLSFGSIGVTRTGCVAVRTNRCVVTPPCPRKLFPHSMLLLLSLHVARLVHVMALKSRLNSLMPNTDALVTSTLFSRFDRQCGELSDQSTYSLQVASVVASLVA
jgi:hypothetical protein